MPLYRKGIDEPLLYIPGAGGGLARSQDCCCENCDGTEVTGCCLFESTTVGGVVYKTVTCEASTECACDLLEGETVPDCATVNCCKDTECSNEGSSCDCLNRGGTVVPNCVDCLQWEPGDDPPLPPDDLPGDTGTGGPGLGPCGANAPTNTDCVYCRWAIKTTTQSPCYHNTALYGSIMRRCCCTNLINSIKAKNPQVYYYQDGTVSYEDYVVYAGMYPLTCTPGSINYYYSNGTIFDHCGDVFEYPLGRYPYTCACTCSQCSPPCS